MNLTRKNNKKPNFKPDFGPFVPNLDFQIFFESVTSTSSEKLFQARILCNLKEN